MALGRVREEGYELVSDVRDDVAAWVLSIVAISDSVQLFNIFQALLKFIVGQVAFVFMILEVKLSFSDCQPVVVYSLFEFVKKGVIAIKTSIGFFINKNHYAAERSKVTREGCVVGHNSEVRP